MLIVFSIIFTTMLYVAMETNEDKAEFRLGLLCCATTLIFCSAPLATLVIKILFIKLLSFSYVINCFYKGDVLRTRSTETLPFYLILSNVLVSAQWFLYGVAVHNTFVQVKSYTNSSPNELSIFDSIFLGA